MRCTDDACPCLLHVDPSTHVPCCPHCHIPLVQSGYADDLGDCPNRHRKGPGRCPARGVVFTPAEWRWIPRDNFHGDDLPSANGWKPLHIPEELL